MRRAPWAGLLLLCAPAWSEPDPEDLFIALRLAERSLAARVKTLAIAAAPATEARFPVSPLAGGPFDEAAIADGLRRLYAANACRDCLDEALLARQVARARDFGERIAAVIESARGAGGWPYRLEPGLARALGTTIRYELSFPSLITRGGHPSDRFNALLYLPRDPAACGRRFPALVIVHHIEDNSNPQKLFAEAIAAHEALPGAGGIASLVLFLPHYGPRKGPEGARFLTPDLAAYEANLAQALSDIHLARDFLASLPMIDPRRISLWGVSLGANIGYVAAAMDPGFSGGYALTVGGGNLPAMIEALRDSKIDLRSIAHMRGTQLPPRREVLDTLAPLDAITFAHRLRGARVLVQSASQDMLVSEELSLEPLLAQFNQEGRGNEITRVIRSGGHVQLKKNVSQLQRILSGYEFFFKPVREQLLRGLDGARPGACARAAAGLP